MTSPPSGGSPAAQPPGGGAGLAGALATHHAIASRAREVLPADPRILAAWLEGSFAGGQPDRWSDVDLHVAVTDDDVAVVAADGESIVGRLAPVLSSLTFPLGPVRLVACTVEGPVRVDFYVEPLSAVAGIVRLGATEVFHGDPPEFETSGLPADPAAHLARLVRGYFFGFMTPARLHGRGDHASLVLNAVQVVFQFVVPAMLAQTKPAMVTRDAFHAERQLSPEQQRRVRELVAATGEMAAGIATGPPAEAAVRRAHELVLGTLLTELRTACELHGVPWPADTEAQARDYLGRELGLDL